MTSNNNLQEIAVTEATTRPALDLKSVVEERRRQIQQAAAEARAVPPTFYPEGPAAVLKAKPRVITLGLTNQQAVAEVHAIVGACRAAGTDIDEAQIQLAQVHLDQSPNPDADEAMAHAVAQAAQEIRATWLVVADSLKVGPKTQETIAELGRTDGLVTVRPGVAETIAQVLSLGQVFIGLDAASIGLAFNSGRFGTKLRVAVDGGKMTVRDNYGRALFTVTQADGAWAVNDRLVKPNTAVMVEATAPFAPGGNTLVAVLNPTSFLGQTLAMLALACQEGGKSKDVVYGWLMGLEMALLPIERETAKQDADTQVFNRDHVLGSLTITKTAKGALRGKATCMTAGVGAQLRWAVPDAEFLPAAKGDWFLTFSKEYLESGQSLVFRAADGQLGLHAKGTKHLDGYYAQVAGGKEIPALIMSGTPFSQGGAMPTSSALLAEFSAVESKTLLLADRSWSSIRALHEAIRAGSWELRVKVGDQVRHGCVLAVVNGQEVRWSKRQSKGAAGAVVTEATLVEAAVMGEPALRLTIRADVVFTGAVKGVSARRTPS